MKASLKHILALIFLLQLVVSHGQFYNGAEQQFGKNRVQYQDFYWQYYKYPRFNVYYYKGGEQLAEDIAKEIENYIPDFEKRFNELISDRIDVVVYKSFSDFKQSNIGYEANQDYNIGGTTQLNGNTFFVYYSGTKVDLHNQIRKGLASLLIEQSLFGASLQERVRSSTLLNLPQWYQKGLIRYFSEGFTPDNKNRFKGDFLNGKLSDFNRITTEQASLAGLALWNFVAEKYGEHVFPDLLTMTSLTRNAEEAFYYILGLDFETLFLEYQLFYDQAFASEPGIDISESVVPLDNFKTQKRKHYTQAKISPKGKYLAYSSNEMGQYRIHVMNVRDGNRIKILKAGHKLIRDTDYSYPVLAWHPTKNILSYVTEEKGKVWLNIYNVNDAKTETKELFGFDKILHLSYHPDGKKLVMSGVNKGKTNLYKYFFAGNRAQALTNDNYNQLEPHYLPNGKDIYFVSNGPEKGSFMQEPGLYTDVYKLENENKLTQLTFTKDINERAPLPYAGDTFTYLADEHGYFNRYIGIKDSSILTVDTVINYKYFNQSSLLTYNKQNILDHSIDYKNGRYYLLALENGEYHIYQGDLASDKSQDFESFIPKALKRVKRIDFNNLDTSTVVNNNYDKEAKIGANKALKFVEGERSGINLENYQFKDDEEVKENLFFPTEKNEELIQNRPYSVNFTTSDFSGQVDNQYINAFYQVLTGPENVSPGLGLFTKIGIKDLFEDYRLTGGVRFSANLENNDYLFKYENFKKRLDKTITFTRVNTRVPVGIYFFRTQTYTTTYENKYPLNEVASLSFTPLVKVDRIIPLSLDAISMNLPKSSLFSYGAKANYVYDNSLPIGMNLRQGIRFKAFLEYYSAQFSQQQNERFNTFVLGFDARHYTRVHRSIVWVNRLAYSATQGNAKVLWFAGGVDRWLYLPENENNGLAPDLSTYAYQGTVTPLRGYNRNIRNGNQFALFNSELRIPVFKYLSKKPLKSRFMENFQTNFFCDLGTAWTGSSPFSEDNTFNSRTISGNPVDVTLRTTEQPIVGGYGFGLRGIVLGYFVRADWAWAIDPAGERERMFYISLTLDI